MTSRENALKYRKVGEAWEDGKDIQWKNRQGDKKWTDYLSTVRPDFSSILVEWRIKPKTPQANYRDWKYDEMSTGLVLKPLVGPQYLSQIVHVFPNGEVLLGTGVQLDPQELREGFLCKWPFECDAKWRPCGVEVAP